jgi:multicomponent Na+:H+ antiporter subunit D
MAHLPALQVIIPLLLAPLLVLVRHRGFAWSVAVLASWASLAIAALLLDQVLTSGVVSYHMGGWAPPWGIELRVDALNAYVLVIVAGIASVVTPFARRSVESEVDADRIHWFYAAWLLALAGLLGITVTGDAFNVFVFFEITSLAQYALIAMGRDRRALTASYQYLIMGTIGTTFLLIGIGLLYMMTGTLNMADLAVRVAEVNDTRTIQAAFAFVTVGVGLKLALFPLHLWLPNAYTYAPSAVTALLAATATKVAVYVLIRFFFTIFGEPPLVWLLLPLALVGIVVPSVVAVFQHDAKRLLAYSSVAQIGYMLLGISLATATGLTAALLHVFNHALMKGALFLALGCVAYRIGATTVAQMAGLGRQMPWTMAAFVVGGLSLIGIPLTAGFVSKWYLVLGALERGWFGVVAVIVGASLVAAVYIWRVVEQAYFHDAPDGRVVREAPLALLVPTWVLVLANLYFGVQTDLTVGVATRAAEMLIGAP